MASSVGIFRWEACEEASVAAGVELGWASGWGVAAGLWVLGVAAGCGCGHVAARHHGTHHPHPLGRRRSRCRRRGRGGVLRHGRGRADGRGRAGGAGVLEAGARSGRRRRRPCSRCRTALLLAKAPATGSASCGHTREGCGSGVAFAHCAGVAEVASYGDRCRPMCSRTALGRRVWPRGGKNVRDRFISRCLWGRFDLESSARERWLSRPTGIGRGGQEGRRAQSRQEGANRAAQLQ